MRLLLVEDDTKLSDMLARSLREQGYAVDVSYDGTDAVYQASVNEYDALILDVNAAEAERARGQPRASRKGPCDADSDVDGARCGDRPRDRARRRRR